MSWIGAFVRSGIAFMLLKILAFQYLQQMGLELIYASNADNIFKSRNKDSIQAHITKNGHGCIVAGKKAVQEVQRLPSNSSVATEHFFEFI